MKRKVAEGYEVLKATGNVSAKNLGGSIFMIPEMCLETQELTDKIDETLDIMRGIISAITLIGRSGATGETEEGTIADYNNALNYLAGSLREQAFDLQELSEEIGKAKYFVKDDEKIDDILFVEKIKGLVKEHLEKKNEE